MATTEEKQELIENIKRPDRYYKVRIYGYGGESVYYSLTKKAYTYWKNILDSDGDSEIIQYLTESNEYDDFELDIPAAADFLLNSRLGADGVTAYTIDNRHTDDNPAVIETSVRHAWFEAPNEVSHSYGSEYNDSRIEIEEIESADYRSPVIKTVVETTDVIDLSDEHEELYESQTRSDREPKYVMMVISSEKGCFYEGVIETFGSFDMNKLRISVFEEFNGDDTIDCITYDNEYIENVGVDTEGKGMSVYMWANVNEEESNDE